MTFKVANRMSDHESNIETSKYLVLDWKIAYNTKTRKDEMELTLFDLHADPEEDCIVDLTMTNWDVKRRPGAWHEIESAARVISKEFTERS